MNVFVLLTDAFGGRGGIAKFNRDLCRSLAAEPLAAQTVALPRVTPVETVENVPERVEYRVEAAGSKLSYSGSVLRTAWRGTFNGVICAHLNLLPIALLASTMQGIPLLLVIHGIDAWRPHSSALVRRSIRYVDAFIAVSHYTKDRFLEWAPLASDQGHVVPDCIDLSAYSPGPKRDDLLDRYDLQGRTVLLTLGRLSAAEQYKGHDEVLEAMPDLLDAVPDLAYLICGDGDDRARLEAKAKRLGLEEQVVFAGYVEETEKMDHYRLADAFVMPGRGEGFGIVYLEALACGIPVVASTADASQEAVRQGELGIIVDPDDPGAVKRGILEALDQPRGDVPEGLEHFSFSRFQKRCHDVIPHVFEAAH